MNKKLFCASLFMSLTGCASVIAQTENTQSLDSVLVTGTRGETRASQLAATVNVVSRQAIEQSHQSNVLPLLNEQVPGLFVTQRGMMGYGVSNGAAGGINMRGLSSVGQVLILIDGHPQYSGVYGHSFADTYQSHMVERVEVLRGPSSVLYGSNAMGGVINIVTRGMKADGVRTHLGLSAGSWGTAQVELTNQVRHGRFTSTVSAQYGRSDNHMPRMGFEQYGGYVKLGYDFGPHWKSFADVDVTHYNASNPLRVTNGTTVVAAPLYEADQYITRMAATAGVENHYDWTDGRISAFCNWGRHKINDGYGPTYHNNAPQTSLFRSRDAVSGISAYQNLRLLPGNRITLGFDYQSIYGRAYYTDRETGKVTPPSKSTTHAHADEVAAYVDVHQQIASWLTLGAGVRYDHHSVAGDEWVPQFGIVARPTAQTQLKLSASKGFRNPVPKEQYLYGMANDQLEAERLWCYELGWQETFDAHSRCAVNLYQIEADNMIQTVAGKNQNAGKFRYRGAEVELSNRFNEHWSFTLNGHRMFMDDAVLACPEMKIYGGVSMRYGRWSSTLGYQHIHNLYTAIGLKVEGSDATYDIKKSFDLLNATVNYQVHKNIQLWLRGDNLLAQRYEINAGYVMPRATFMAGVNISL